MTCFECGSPADHEHHVIPRSLGGTKTVPLCERCHGLVHDRRLTTRHLTRAAMARKASRGEFTGGEAPFGWTLATDGVALVPNESEQEVIRIALGMRACGWSMREIGVGLDDRGFRTRRGKSWRHPQRVSNVLAARVAA